MDKKSILWFKNEKKLIRDLSKEDVPNVFMIECKHLQPQRDSAQNCNRTPHVYYDVCYKKTCTVDKVMEERDRDMNLEINQQLRKEYSGY